MLIYIVIAIIVPVLRHITSSMTFIITFFVILSACSFATCSLSANLLEYKVSDNFS